jgi:malic enzyme
MGYNRITYAQHSGSSARESEFIAAAERTLAGVASEKQSEEEKHKSQPKMENEASHSTLLLIAQVIALSDSSTSKKKKKRSWIYRIARA